MAFGARVLRGKYLADEASEHVRVRAAGLERAPSVAPAAMTTEAGRTISWYAVRAPSPRGSPQTRGGSMGDKSPKSKNKDKKQQDAVKDKKSADMKAKQAAKSTK
jgi:hypothetical protein